METEYIFYAETTEVHSFKVLINFIKKNFNEYNYLYFKVNKNGIFIDADNKNNILIHFSFLSKNMKKFEYVSRRADNYEEEEYLFYHLTDIAKELDYSRKNNLLFLSLKSKCLSNPFLNIKTTDNYHIIDNLGEYYPEIFVSITKIESMSPNKYPSIDCKIPSTYCDFPINLNNIKLKWSENSYINPNFVRIKLSKTRVEFEYSYTKWICVFIGEYSPEILYERTFKAEEIKDILKMSSFGTIRIYHGKGIRDLLFSTMIENGIGYINKYVSPIKSEEEIRKMNENKERSSPRIFKSR